MVSGTIKVGRKVYMNKAAIKKFAIEARKKLIDSVTDKAGMLGITETSCSEPITRGSDFEVYKTIAGTEVTLNRRQCEQRRRLVSQIESRGFEAVIEEVAYTWFNRICAIRFMEVNDYLPNRVRVLSSEKEGKMEPDLVTQAPDVELDLTVQEKEEIINWKMSGTSEDTDKLYCKLFLKQCHQLHEILPGLFEADSDYMELLFGISYTNKDDVIYMLVNPETGIPEEDFNVSTLDEEGNPTGQVEIIGWLYQYYNTELKDDTFAKLKKNIKITKERIPAATQLFTPDWIVRYMVENSVGRIWIEHLRAVDPDTDEKATAERFGWKYYLPEAEQEEAVNVKLAEIRTTYKDLKPTDITCIDPCMGSGHILIAMFDVLMDIYESAGYDKREAAFEIVEHNIHGLDIDQRAYQLAYFAVMMKGRGYNRRFLRGRDGKPEPKVYAIVESNDINRNHLQFFGTHLSEMERNLAVMQIEGLLDTFVDAREYGSILNVDACDWDVLERFVEDLDVDGQISFESVGSEETQESLRKLVRVAKNLGQKYDAVVTNPPYMGDLNRVLQDYVKKCYPNSKHDICSVFIEKCLNMAKDERYIAMITQNAFMFLSRYEKMRRNLLQYEFVNMIHLGAHAFDSIGGEVVQTAAFCVRKKINADYIGTYERLVSFPSEIEKKIAYIKHQNTFYCKNKTFDVIPKTPMTYWVSQDILSMFNLPRLDTLADPRVGMFTTDNDKYLREWWEPSINDIGFEFKNKEEAYKTDIKWFPYNKGGGFRRWYGNIDLVVYWQHGGKEIKQIVIKKYPYLNGNYDFVLKTDNPYYHPGITWSGLTSGSNSFRMCGNGFLFDTNKGAMIFEKEIDLIYLLGFLNTKVAQTAINLLNSTISLQIGDVASIPVAIARDQFEHVKTISQNCVDICMNEWNSYETAWDFKRHPLLPNNEPEGITTLFGVKIGAEKWIKKLYEGSACFSPVGDFIVEGETTGNNEQGDKFEGVFARLKKDNPLINSMKEKLGADLEQVTDGEYVLLRRKSCREIPVFCLYGMYKEDAEEIERKKTEDGTLQSTIQFQLSDKMFDEFLNAALTNDEKIEPWSMGMSLGHFQAAIEKELDQRGIQHKAVKVKYDLSETEEFFIEPTYNYDELAHKSDRLNYQKEIRWILPNIRQMEKFILPYTPLSKESAGVTKGKIVFKFEVVGHVKEKMSIASCFKSWNETCDERFGKLKQNEEELNRIFIDIYGLQDELISEVEDKDITVRKADLSRDIRSFISYAVGCMFGRYSLDKEGLVYAGGDFEKYYERVDEVLVDENGDMIITEDGFALATGEEYYGKIKVNNEWVETTFIPDFDNCIPITDEEYFSDDMVGRFVDFVKTVYGADTLEENLDFIANALGHL